MKWVKPDYSKRRVRRAGERLIDATSTSAELNNAMDEALGRKERMVADFSRLGDLYEARGELELAEEMFKKSLAINEALGHKERMADDFSRLGDLYEARGEFDLAGEMYFSAIEINFKNI